MAERNLTEAQVETLSEFLYGTCQSLEDGLRAMNLSEDGMTLGDCQSLDERVLVCTTCNWWEEAFEIDHAEGECRECVEHGAEWDGGKQ